MKLRSFVTPVIVGLGSAEGAAPGTDGSVTGDRRCTSSSNAWPETSCARTLASCRARAR